jgi:hypothetical protein
MGMWQASYWLVTNKQAAPHAHSMSCHTLVPYVAPKRFEEFVNGRMVQLRSHFLLKFFFLPFSSRVQLSNNEQRLIM